MSDSVTLTATPRTSYGSRASQKLRKQGQLPAIVYGHKEAVVSVTVPYLEFDRAVRVKHVRVLDLVIGAKTEKVLIRELQWDHLGSEMVHVDFARVSKDEKVKVTIPVKLKNAPKSTGGGVLDQPFHTLHVECLAIAIPEEITIDVTDLTLGHPILGDPLYSSPDHAARFARMHLHATRIAFIHPRTRVPMQFESPVPF